MDISAVILHHVPHVRVNNKPLSKSDVWFLFRMVFTVNLGYKWFIVKCSVATWDVYLSQKLRPRIISTSLRSSSCSHFATSPLFWSTYTVYSVYVLQFPVTSACTSLDLHGSYIILIVWCPAVLLMGLLWYGTGLCYCMEVWIRSN